MTRRLSRLYRGSESSIRFNLLMEGVKVSNLERDLGKLDIFADLVARIEDYDSNSRKK